LHVKLQFRAQSWFWQKSSSSSTNFMATQVLKQNFMAAVLAIFKTLVEDMTL